MTVRIGVVGVGRWALRHHLPALMNNPKAVVAAIADPDPVRLDRAAQLFEVGRRFRSADDLYAAGGLDGVVIATPHAEHYAPARTALDAGLHVLLEKPMTLRGTQAWDLVARARRARRHLVIGYTYHFTASVGHARDLVGQLGALSLTSVLFATSRAHLYRPLAQRGADDPDPATYADPVAGGQGHTEATHALANLLYVTGLSVDRVSALMRTLDYPVDVVDTMQLEFTGGCVGTLASTGVVPVGRPEQRLFHYHSPLGELVQDLTTGELSGNVAGHSVHRPGAPTEERYPTDRPTACLVDLITGGRNNPAPPELGAEVASCLEAAYRSARCGGRPMTVYRPSTVDGPTAGPDQSSGVDDLERFAEPAVG